MSVLKGEEQSMDTRWSEIADRLRRQIERGELAPGAQITPEAQLATKLGVSRATVRRALQALVEEGLVTSGKGKLGRRVRSRPKLLTWDLTDYEGAGRGDTHSADAWSLAITAQGMTPHQDVTVMRDYARGEIAAWLGLSEQDEVVIRRRVRYADDRPYQLATSVFPYAIAAGTPLDRPGDQAAPGGLLAAIGHPQATLSDRIRSRMPSRQEIDMLDMTSGTPVIEHIRIGYGHDGTPVRAMTTIAPADRWELHYTLTLSGGQEQEQEQA